jgi:hypothetical protein
MELGSKAIMYHRSFSLLLIPQKRKHAVDLLMNVCRPVADGGVLGDRTGTFAESGAVKTLTTPIPVIPNGFTKTFEEVCAERAAALVNTGKTLIVTWSGGIDSTCVLVSLIKACGSNTDQIKVMFESRSIDENPDFYNNHIKDKLNHEIFNEYFAAKCLPGANDLVINGDNVGQIFGMSRVSFMENRYDDWKPYVRSQLTNDAEYNFYIEKAEQQFVHSPFPIETIFDLHWWVSFSMRWNNPQVRVWRVANNYTKDMYEATIPFFGTNDFQIWSMLNHDKKLGNTPASYKMVMKDIIYEYDGNEEYYNNMTSLPSGGARMSNDQNFNLDSIKYKLENDQMPILIDSNYNRFYRSDVINDKAKFKPLVSCFDESGNFITNSPDWFIDTTQT